jgi:hypothetical protein
MHRALLLACLCATPLFAEPRTETSRRPLLRSVRSASTAPAAASSTSTTNAPMASTLESASEFGDQVIVTREATWEPWQVELSADGFFTDNVALAPRREQDAFLRNGVNVSYSNRIAGDWSMDVSLGQDFVRYDRFTDLDFDFTHASTALAYRAPWLDGATMVLRYSYAYLSDPGFGDQILSSHMLSFGVQKSWKLAAKHRLIAGLSTEPNLAAEPTIALRHEHAIFTGWTWKHTPDFHTQLVGRIGYHVSPNTGRTDWNYATVLSASYAITAKARIAASASMAWNESNRAAFSYQNLISGLYVGLNFNF